MQKAANAIRGWAEVQVRGAAPEEFFNRCARDGIGFWRAKRQDEVTWTCRVAFLDAPKVTALGQKGQWEVRLLRRGGLPGTFWKLRRRYAFLAGMAACIAAVAILSRFVVKVEVSGNVKVPTGAILTQLRAQGVKPGAFGPGLDTRQISHGVILELPDLSWMSINLHGMVAEVLVREGNPRPELMEEDEPAHIAAKYPGIITRVETTSGQQLVGKGDTVVAGDTLINSWVDFVEPEGYAGDMGGMTVRATGKVWARTWHTLKAALPLNGDEKVYTGREKSRWSLEILGRRMKISPGGGISYERYDKITKYHTPSLPGGRTLPISLRREVCREYELQSVPIDAGKGEVILRNALEERLATLVDKGEVLKTDWSVREANGLLTVTLLAECEQQIGVTVEE